MAKILKKTTFEEFYSVNEYVAKTSPMRTHYESFNPIEKWLWQQKKQVIKKILNKLNIKNIIDFGCGDGGLLEIINRNINYLGVDISPIQVGYVQELIRKTQRKNSQIITADILNLKQLKDSTYDAALVCDVVEHVLSVRNLFKEIKRIVKKDGYIIFSIPNEILLQSTRAILLKFPLRSPDHLNSISTSDIKQNFPKILNEFYIPINFSFKLSLIGILLVQNDK